MKLLCTQVACVHSGTGGGFLTCSYRTFRECPHSRYTSRTEDQCSDFAKIGDHGALQFWGLRSLADSVEEAISPRFVEAVIADPQTPDWVKRWIVAEILPGMTGSIEALRIAATCMEASGPPTANREGAS